MHRWTPGHDATWETAFPSVSLEDLLRPRREAVRPDVFRDYQPITIHFDGSIVARKRTDSFKGTMFAAMPGDLVYSKIDLRNGAIGLVPEAFSRVVVTSEYPVFVPDAKQVDARYLALLLRTPNFLHLLKKSASGTSGRKRVDSDNFLGLEIPLPGKPEQQRLVHAYESAVASATALEVQARDVQKEGTRAFESALGLVPPPDLPRKPIQVACYKDIDRWSHEGILDRAILSASGKPTERYPLVALGDVIADLVNGWSPQCLDRPAEEGEWGVLKLGAVSFGQFDANANKALPSRLKPKPEYEVREGDVLISRANVVRLVGACAMVHETIQHLMLCDKIFRVTFLRESTVLPEFLVEVLRTPSVRQQIEAAATGTSPTMKNISKPALLDLIFPLPSGANGLDVQLEIISSLIKIRERSAVFMEEAKQIRKGAWSEFLAAVFQ